MTMIPSRALFFSASPAVVTKRIKTDFGALDRADVPNPATNFGGSRLWAMTPVFAAVQANSTPGQLRVNFGGSAFATAPPSGFNAWGAAVTLDPGSSTLTLTAGNLTATAPGGSGRHARSTASYASGKWYFEVTINVLGAVATNMAVGVWNGTGNPSAFGDTGDSLGCYDDGGVHFAPYYPGDVTLAANHSVDSLAAAFAAADVIGIAVDVDFGKIWFRRNGGAWKGFGSLQAFGEFRLFARNQGNKKVTLDLQGINSPDLTDFIAPFDGIKALTVLGNGATLPGIRGTCLAGMPSDATHSARLQHVNPGDATVTLVNPTDAAIFAVGDMCTVDGLEMQSSGGFPPNHHYIQFARVTNITGGVIAITPVAGQEYKTTWPLTSSPSYDTGGPATLHKMVPSGPQSTNTSFDTDASFQDITFSNLVGPSQSQVYFPGRRVRLTNCTFTNCAPIATTCADFQATGCTCTTTEVETDKECASVVWNNCNLNLMTYQSSSIQQNTLNNCTIGTLVGVGRAAQITNSTFATRLRIGVQGYGFCDTAVLTNVTSPLLEASFDAQMPRSDFSLAGTTLTYNGSDFAAIIRWAIPGGNYYFNATGAGSYSNFGSPFTITDVFVVAGKVTMSTTLTAMPPNNANHAAITKGACGGLTATNCSGCPELLDASLAPANSRMFSYTKRIGDLTDGPTITIAGRLVSLTVNVTQPYTGAQPTSVLQISSPFGNRTAQDYSAWTDTTFGGGINLKLAGSRVFTPTTSTGMLSGDSLVRDGLAAGVLGNLWLQGVVPTNPTNMSGDTTPQKPVIQYEIVANQT